MYYNPKFIDRADAIPVAVETMFGGENEPDLRVGL